MPLLLAALALASTGCSLISGEHEAETRFPVRPGSATTFNGWSEITLTQNPQQVSSAELMYVRVEAESEDIKDMGFVRSITGDTKVGEQLTRIVQKSPMPAGERIVPLDMVYEGDIRQFFYEDPEGEGWTIHVVWNGEVDPTYPLPPDGVWVKVKLAVRVEE
ncbi:hypothetical protein [Chondromyces apiculatus]|uniref:Uncharacterized protein n=1 Tax=Chondromyces apiculatus DSM 436 TaxID=1192034 RepID=A0A017SYQ5_9BACT|nr:hypothetical protein [Chondromyces apiculatus]EYF02099.1 Hypothetical protein CAP_7439 [Chondromyces apiculatus DSM 436]